MTIDDLTIHERPILWVEDSSTYRMIIDAALDEVRDRIDLPRLIFFESGEGLVNWLRWAEIQTPPVAPLILFLDLRLPGEDGLSLLKNIKAAGAWRWLPIVVVSTSQAPDDVGQAWASGADNYFVKPVEFDDLVELLHDELSQFQRSLFPSAEQVYSRRRRGKKKAP